MSKLYFTRAGAERIFRQKTELLAKLKATQAQKGEAAQVGGNQWHDNFAFEQLTRDEESTNFHIRDLNTKISQMVLVEEVSADTKQLRIGHVAVLDVDGEERVCQIGGFEDSDPEANPAVISYLAPLVQKFIGRERGHSESVQIAGRRREVVLSDIQLPRKEE